ncbi:DUF2017 domain-containing protein [Pseudactinotalea suaedae]|uniref:DUF2017 domain-containing protein n=1 Tax=Pseudactinotalea suaedae TaxID=1524924 RepID=UPI0012E309B7|nr:DUF2017 domain-containing protein [Pseudactinotalea suaedae]
MKGFARKRGVYVAQLDRTERTILSRVVADTALLLGTRLDIERPADDDDPLAGLAWSADGVAEPSDPALARLLPSASEDEDVAAEFRRLTEGDLRAAKVERLRMVWGALLAPGERLEVLPERAMDFAAALTDVRLVLAERLEIQTDDDADAVYQAATRRRRSGEVDEVRAALASLYMALTWLQESLMSAMLKAL